MWVYWRSEIICLKVVVLQDEKPKQWGEMCFLIQRDPSEREMFIRVRHAMSGLSISWMVVCFNNLFYEDEEVGADSYRLCQSKHLSSLRHCLGKTFSQWKVKVRQMKDTLASAKENIQRWLTIQRNTCAFISPISDLQQFHFWPPFFPFPLAPLCLSSLAVYISCNNTQTEDTQQWWEWMMLDWVN